MTLFDLILACLIFAVAAHFISIAVLMFRSLLPPDDQPAHQPPVTLLRPACGIENNIEETLASAFAIDYPDFEIVFCVADDDDPVLPIITRLMEAHPRVKSRLLIGNDRISINPKLNNLVKGWRETTNEHVVMADSNVLIPPNYINELLARWSPDAGLVCSPPIGIRPEGLAAEIECSFLNTYQGRWQLGADALGFGLAQGKTMLWLRSELDAAGGLPALASEPAEDAAATKIVNRAGRRVRLVRNPYPQPLGRRRVIDIWRRQLRWARLRRATFAPLYALEIFSGGFLPLVAALILVALNPAALPWLVGLFVAWYGTETLLAARMGWPVSPRMMLSMLIRDLALPALWIAGWTGNTFVWRGNAMNIKPIHAVPALPRPAAAYNTIALRLRSARVVRSFRALGAFRAATAPRGVRAATLPRWSWKTGNKTR